MEFHPPFAMLLFKMLSQTVHLSHIIAQGTWHWPVPIFFVFFRLQQWRGKKSVSRLPVGRVEKRRDLQPVGHDGSFIRGIVFVTWPKVGVKFGEMRVFHSKCSLQSAEKYHPNQVLSGRKRSILLAETNQ